MSFCCFISYPSSLSIVLVTMYRYLNISPPEMLVFLSGSSLLAGWRTLPVVDGVQGQVSNIAAFSGQVPFFTSDYQILCIYPQRFAFKLFDQAFLQRRLQSQYRFPHLERNPLGLLYDPTPKTYHIPYCYFCPLFAI